MSADTNAACPARGDAAAQHNGITNIIAQDGAAVESDRARLAQLEGVIARGMQTFLEVGNALLEIQTNKLYRADYSTFEDYLRERWNLSRRRGYQLVEAAKVAKALPVCTTVHTTERALRQVAKVEPAKRAEVWQRAEQAAGGDRVQQKHVEAAVNVHRGARRRDHNAEVERVCYQLGAVALTLRSIDFGQVEAETAEELASKLRAVRAAVGRIVWVAGDDHQRKAADLLNVNVASVAVAGVVLEHGSPELVRSVERGEMDLGDAVRQIEKLIAQPVAKVSA